ncbi:ribosomal-protein-S5p-alanine acetyltransferase [Streptococcus mutans M230]|nr:ribosomal-protein-S5p-alanine acetyltransferase [Streptococcus mutans M230]
MGKNIYRKLADHRILETKHLFLRPVTLDDAKDMYEYASDEEVTRYTFAKNESLEETKNKIAAIYLTSPLGHYGIELKSSGKFIGTIDLFNLKEDMLVAEFGYCLNKAYWNKGLMTEAVNAFVALAFEELDLNCLIARYDSKNPASGRVMEKAGMFFSHESLMLKKLGMIPIAL